MNLRPQNILPTALSALAVFAVAAGPADAAKMAKFTAEGPGGLAKPQARSAAGCDNTTARAGQVSEDALANSTVCLLNVERTSRGLRALRVNGRLSAAAQQHTSDMVRRRYFSHTSRSGSDMSDRIRGNGYLSGARSWMIGENLAWGSGGQSTPQMIVDAWMASPPHQHNLLLPGFNEIGIAAVKGTPLWKLDLLGVTVTTEYGWRNNNTDGKKKRKCSKKQKAKRSKRCRKRRR